MTALSASDSTSSTAAIYRWYEAEEARAGGGNRPHLGGSLIGHPCERYLWLTFRWAGGEKFDGRMLRLFNTGHRAEARFVAELRAIGAEVHDLDERKQQHRVSAHGGHFGGSMDAVARGLPEAPKTWHLVEFKTHNDKSFAELVKKGVRAAKPQHFAQMQVYMGLAGLTRAFYLAENKNTSEVYAERIEADAVEHATLLERARRVIEAGTPPVRLSEDPAWFECKRCAFAAQCHGNEVPAVNCRTCAHSTPRTTPAADQNADGGVWQCEHAGLQLDLKGQRDGCNGHRFIPVLLERVAQQTDVSDEVDGNLAVHYTLKDGGVFANGYPPHYASTEIKACAHTAMLADGQMKALKHQFEEARVVA